MMPHHTRGGVNFGETECEMAVASAPFTYRLVEICLISINNLL